MGSADTPKDYNLVKKMTKDMILVRINFFLSILAQDKSPATVGTYRRALGVFMSWIDEQGESIELSQKNLEQFPLHLKLERRVTPSTVQTYLTALRKFFAFLVKQGLLDDDPVKNLRIKHETPAQSRDILTKEEIKSLFEVSRGEKVIELRDRAILCCMLIEGLSETEVSKCNYRDLEHTLMGEELRVIGKGSPMCVPLDQRTYRSLRAYLAKRSAPIKPKDPLFITHGPRGKLIERVTVRTVRSRMRGLLDRAKIIRPTVSPQSLAHTAIYLQIQNGISREDLKMRTRPWRFFGRINDLKAKGLIDPSY